MALNESNLIIASIAGLATAIAAGYLGTFMVLRRIALVSDALSHVALPGLALGLIFNLNPFIGAFAFLLLAALLVAGIEKRTDLPTDAIVGVLFSASLAFGILLTPEPELLEALFGDFTEIGPLEALITVIASVLIVLLTFLYSGRLMLSIVASETQHVSGKKVSRANIYFMIMLAASVALGIKFVGTLLMGTLTIIPAAAAKNVANSLFGFGLISMAFAALSVIIGMGAVYLWQVPAGPAVILASAAIFLVTLLFRRPVGQ